VFALPQILSATGPAGLWRQLDVRPSFRLGRRQGRCVPTARLSPRPSAGRYSSRPIQPIAMISIF